MRALILESKPNQNPKKTVVKRENKPVTMRDVMSKTSKLLR